MGAEGGGSAEGSSSRLLSLALSVFEEARDIEEGARRDAFVIERCGADDELLEQVRALLRVHGRERAEVEAPDSDLIAGSLRNHVSAMLGGTRVAGYRIVRPIAVGGMGAVYEAEQDRPRRRVALKIVRPSDADRETLVRLRYEGELLGRLAHPGIAKVFEVGFLESVDGEEHPFLAMEFVEDARDLLTFAREQELGREQRSSLFEGVCAAVHHAHLRGVVHRDLKPANVLVGGDGLPRLIDFGIARDMQGGQDLTEPGVVPGTLRYVAPELLDGRTRHADVRADVYALGVMLYELLCGRPPHDVDGLPPGEAFRVLTHEAPLRPRRARPELPIELEWLLLRALERDVEGRYGGADELAADLARYRLRRPLEAGPATTRYRLTAFLRRNRKRAAMAAVGAIGLSVGGAIALAALLEAAAAGERARYEADSHEAVASFLEGLLTAARDERGGSNSTIRQVLLDAPAVAEGRFPDRPEVEGHVHFVIGKALTAVGLGQDAVHELERSVADLSAGVGPDHERTLVSRRHLLDAKRDVGYGIQVEAMRQLVADFDRVLGPDHVESAFTRAQLGVHLVEADRLAEGLVELDAAARRLRGRVDDEQLVWIEITALRGRMRTGDTVGAREILDRVLARSWDRVMELELELIELQLLAYESAPPEEWLARARAARWAADGILGPTSQAVLRAITAEAAALEAMGRGPESIAAREEAFDISLAGLGIRNEYTTAFAIELANARYREGELEDAAFGLELAIDLAIDAGAGDEFATAEYHFLLCLIQREIEADPESIRFHAAEARRIALRFGGATNEHAIRATSRVVEALTELGRVDEAIALGVETADAAGPDASPRGRAELADRLATAYAHVDRIPEALAQLRLAARICEQSGPAGAEALEGFRERIDALLARSAEAGPGDESP